MFYVVGHKIPDTDAILSSIIYAAFLRTQGVEAKAVRLGDINNETFFVLRYLGRDIPELVSTLPAGSPVVLTDHNEKQQSLDNIDDVKVVSIIDHHHFRFTTTEPIEIIVKPIASTCSVIYSIWKASGKPMPQDIARGLMAGLISDSLYFRSPTTTQADRDIFEDMKSNANIDDPEKFSLDMFTAKSDLGDISIRDLITLDYKTFQAGEDSFGIGSVETINPSYALNRKEEIIPELLKYKQELGLKFIALCVIDILAEKNTAIIPSDDDAAIIKHVFNLDVENNLVDLGKNLSKKKLVGPISTYFI